MDNIKCNATALASKYNMSYVVENYNMLLANCTHNKDFDFSSQPDKDTETAFKLLFYFLAAVENVLLLYVMYKDPLKRFRNSPSYFIINFTVADLVTIISGIYDSIFHLNPQKSKHVQELAGCISGIGIQTSFLIIMIFAIDRFSAIGHPYQYQNIMSKKFVLVILIFLPWSFSIVALPVIYFAPAYRSGRALTNLFAIDLITLISLTLIIHPLTHWTFKKKIKDLSSSSYANIQIQKEDLKIEKVLTTTVLVVSTCLITFMSPYLVAFIFSIANCNECLISHAFQSFWMYYPLLTAVRLMTNSIMYAWRLPLYRASLKVLFLNTRLQPLVKCFDNSSEAASAGTIGRTTDNTISSGFSNNNASFEEPINTSPALTPSRPPGFPNEMGMKNLGMRNEVEDTCFDEIF